MEEKKQNSALAITFLISLRRLDPGMPPGRFWWEFEMRLLSVGGCGFL